MSLDKLSNGAKILLAGGILLLIDSFFAWNKECVGAGGFEVCGEKGGWSGVGVIMGLLVIALIAWEVVLLLDVKLPELPLKAELISAAIAALVVLFAVIRFISEPSSLGRAWPAWAGLILAIIIAIGAFLRFQEGGGEMPKRNVPPAA